MSKTDKAKKRARIRQGQRHAPSAPRVIGANDNHANDNAAPVVIGGLTLSPDLARSFRKAEADLAATMEGPNGLVAPDLARRRDGHLAMLELELALEAQTDAKRMRAVRAEINALEKTRGGGLSVERARDKRGQDGEILKVSRDGLETLRTAGSITAVQHAAGLRYRADYELLDPEKGLTPPSLDQTRNIVRGGEGFASKRREREVFVRDLEAMIQDEDPTCRGAHGTSDVERIGRAVWALRQVAGKGDSLMVLSSSGSVQKRTSEALMIALDCAAIAYDLD